MRRTIAWTLTLFWALPGLLSAGEEPAFERMRVHLAKLVPLTIDKGKLAVDYRFWDAEQDRIEKLPAEEKDKLLDEVDSTPAEFKAQRKELRARSAMMKHDLESYIQQKAVLDAFATLSTGNRSGGSGRGWSNGTMNLRKTTDAFDLDYKLSKTECLLEYRAAEKQEPQRLLRFEDTKDGGIVIRLLNVKHQTQALYAQGPYGAVALILQGPGINDVLTGETLSELIQKNTDKVQRQFLRPLFDAGVEIKLHRDLPTVMAVAVSGYSPPPPDIAAKAAALLKQLDAEEMEQREQATKELIALYPRAMKPVRDALAATQEVETKTRLTRVINAHPGIAKALPFVEAHKLHEDKAYILHVFKNVPFFKAAARARLTQLYGKDHGDDPAVWPVP